MVSDCLSPGPKRCCLEECKGLGWCSGCGPKRTSKKHQEGAASIAPPVVSKRLNTVTVKPLAATHDSQHPP